VPEEIMVCFLGTECHFDDIIDSTISVIPYDSLPRCCRENRSFAIFSIGVCVRCDCK
jgi:hypothetical protein